jgi:glucokinase
MILSFDIGATNIKTGIFEHVNEEFLHEKNYKTEDNFESFILQIKDIITYYLLNFEFNKIGIGFPGNINKMGEIVFSPNLPFLKHKNIYSIFAVKENLEIRFENDANCAAIGALIFYKKYSDLITITLGTGVGGGIILNKRILKNSRDLGFEIGHTTVVANGTQCSCGKKGCMEAYSSSTGMIKRYNKNLKEFIELYRLYKSNDKEAKGIIEEGFYYLGVGISNLINIFAPEAVVITGGISNIFNEFKDYFFKGIKENTLDFLLNKTNFEIYKKNNLGLLGAAGLFN